MFDTIKRSFRLVKLCLHVLAVDKELIFFPVFSSIGVILVMLTFLGVGIGIGALDRINAGTVGGGDLVVAFGFYVLSYFVIIFFNSALVYAAHERLAGGDPNIRSGLNGAMQSVVTIFMWAVIAATVGPDSPDTLQPGATEGRRYRHDCLLHRLLAGRGVVANHLLHRAADSH